MKRTIIGVAIAAVGIIGPAHADASHPELTAWRCAYTGDANVGYAIPSNITALTADVQLPTGQYCIVRTRIGPISGTWVRLGSVRLGS